MSKLRYFKSIAVAVCASAGLAAFVANSDLGGTALAGIPNAGVLQAAYNLEATPGNTKHDKDLKIVEARCFEKKTNNYNCFITFVSSRDADRRLYYDVAEITRADGNWSLKSGICKR